MQNHQQHISSFKSSIQSLSKKEGKLILLEGEQGLGKTHLLEEFSKICQQHDPKILNIRVQNQDFDEETDTRSFRPILKAVEALHNASTMSAKKKLAFNMSLTVLTSIPLIGDAFYAAKELSRDWKQYKKDQSQEQSSELNKSIQLIDAIKAKASAEPVVLIFDDAHSFDNASVGILKKITDELDQLKLILTVAYDPSKVQNTTDNLFPFVSRNANSITRLEPLSRSELKEYSEVIIPYYSENTEFDTWFYSVTGGVLGEIAEYRNYFRANNPFDENGNLILDVESESLPTSAAKALAVTLENLTQEENDLFICAATEGREFSVSILGEIYKKNPLEIISKIRSLDKYKIVRSVGAFNKFGTKTTVYRFNHNYHFRYFRDLPEYEEKVELHSRISEILKIKLGQTEDHELKKDIASQILFHSGESENNEVQLEAIKILRAEAVKTGDTELSDHLSARFDLNENENSNGNPNLSAHISGSLIGFDNIRNLLVNRINSGKISEISSIASSFIEDSDNDISKSEQILLRLISIRSIIEVENYDNAKLRIAEIESDLKELENKQLECIMLNTKAILFYKQEFYKRAISYLKKAAELAIDLPPEMSILTLVNISICLEQSDPEESKKYQEVASRLKKEYNFDFPLN